MRTQRLALAATLFTAGCSNDRLTAAAMTAEMTAETTAKITEAQVATTIAAMATGLVALQEDSPGLLEQVQVTDANARVIALQRVPGGRVVEAELEEEDGRLLHSYEIRVADRPGIVEVEIDARTGAFVSEEREDDDEDGSSEDGSSENGSSEREDDDRTP